jgi:AcrR family transcriptional regulator
MSSRGKAGTPVGPQGSPTGAGSRERRATEAPEKGAADAGGRGTRAADTAPPRPRTKAAQREATTAALIDAARELFAGRGYANVGTEEIVQQAGVTRGALYHHFRSGKEELFRAVVVQISAETAGRVRAAAQANDDPWNALVEGIDAFLV